MDRSTSRRTFLAGMLGAAAAGVLVACDAGGGDDAALHESADAGRPDAPGLAESCSGVLGPANLGLCYAWPDTHDGGQMINWLGAEHPAQIVRADLATMASMGVVKVRAFCQLESIMSFDGREFSLVPELAANLHRTFDEAAGLGISLLPVITESHVNETATDLDGKFRWDLAQTPSGRAIYGRALETYAREFGSYENVVMWETQNEPYGNITWATVPAALGVADDDAHEWLRVAYDAVKGVVGDDAIVGFSDLEEEQQDKYRLVADPERRGTLVDDCTDVYSLHIYRNETAQIADFGDVTDKPLWCVELGAYNYDDPTGEAHGGQPAHGDLYDESVNDRVLREMAPFLVDAGFELLMPWSFANNGGMVEHRPDGTHDLKASARWMVDELTRC